MSLILSCVLVLLIYFYLTQRRPRNFPPGPVCLPFFGNSLQLRRASRKLGGIHRVFEKWSKELNSPDVVGFRLGGRFVIVGLSEKAVKEIHMRSVFDGRPRNLFSYLRTFNTYAGITFAEGDLWREHRSFATKRLKSVGFGGDPMQKIIQRELLSFKGVIAEKMRQEGSMWPGEVLVTHVMNVLWNFAAGSEYSGEDCKFLLELLLERSKAFDFSGGLLADLPWLRFIAPKYCGYNLLLHFNERIQDFLGKIINDHHRSFSEEKANDDLIYAFIKEMKSGEEEGRISTFTDTQLMLVMVDLFLGGSHTTSSTLDLALMTLVLHQDIQEKIHEEVKQASAISNGSFLSIGQHRDLPQTEAYLMEIARFYNIAPVSGPRRVLEDTELCGFNIPKDTTVLIGTEAVHMNKDTWCDPEIFRPSRFLNDSSKVCRSEQLLQFGQGRRMCLGVSLAKAFLFTFLTGIVCDYKLSLAEGEEPPDQQMTPGIFKIVKPYRIKFTKRV